MRSVPRGEGGIGGLKRKTKTKSKAVVESNRDLLLGKLVEQLHRPYLLCFAFGNQNSKSKSKSIWISLTVLVLPALQWRTYLPFFLSFLLSFLSFSALLNCLWLVRGICVLIKEWRERKRENLKHDKWVSVWYTLVASRLLFSSIITHTCSPRFPLRLA